MKKILIKLLALLPFGLMLSSCDKEEILDKALAFPTITIEGVSNISKSGGSDVHALYFGDFEIVAYDYRPGQSIQNHSLASGFSGEDWSYFVILPGGYVASRDNLLFNSGVLNVSDFLEHQYSDNPMLYLNQDYLDASIPFKVDVLEVVIYRTGIVKNNKYYGMNANFNGHDKHPLHKYPDYEEIPDFFAYTVWPGLASNNSQNINVMFVNDEYINEPVQIIVNDGIDPVDFTQTSRELSEQEEEFIKSLVDQGTKRRFYTYLNIIPYNGPVVWDFSNNIAPDITVKINMDEVIDMSLTDLEAVENTEDGYWTNIYYLGDQSDIPFGLEIDF